MTFENVGLGAQTLALGLIVVFSALAVIWLVVAVIGAAFRRKSREKAADSPAVAPSPAQASASDGERRDGENSEEVAAIVAAICAYENKPLGSFRVVSFKKR